MKYIQFERIAKGLSVTQAAKKLGIERTVYSRIENGRREPTKEQAEKITNFYKIGIQSLLENMPYPPELKEGKIQWLARSVKNENKEEIQE